MMQKTLICLCALWLVVGCSSKPKTPEGADGTGVPADSATVNEADIQNRDLSIDPCGSDCGTIPGLSTVNFAYDSSALTEEAKSILAKNAEWIKANTNVALQIEGHCDSKGSDEYNRSLGARRAEVVKAYLKGLGVDTGRLNTISWGEEKLLALGDSEADNAKNRRANFAPTK
ncbi:OmpA family protein [bacterium]|nr:OmpA family protein [bacterium]